MTNDVENRIRDILQQHDGKIFTKELRDQVHKELMNEIYNSKDAYKENMEVAFKLMK